MSPDRRALCLGVGSFSVAGEDEPDLDAWQSLTFAADRARALRAALSAQGYRCVPVDADNLTAAELGEQVRAAICSAAPDDVLIVHVLSHGLPARTGLYAIGADGVHDPASKIETWLSWVEDYPDRPLTLFLLDLCHSGAATRLPWQLDVATSGGRAWVVAAAGPDEPAYNGRFSTAIANVLTAIHKGDLDVHPGLRHVPLGTVITRIRREVDRLTGDGYGQRVTATPIDGEYPDLPFFPNPAFHDDPVRNAVADLDAAVAPFVDVRLDAEHFQDRASGLGPLRGRIQVGCFTGRAEELTVLSRWLDSGAENLCVVTGAPGTGKSALLGILVCAAHPRLRQSTMDLWRHVAVRPSANEHLVAVHARQSGVGELTASLARQLGVLESSDPNNLLDAIGEREQQPVIVVDALDEAIDPETVMTALLQPLIQRRRPDGKPACRLLIAMRPWTEFESLREHAGLLIDLDEVPPQRIRTELTQYVAELLELSPAFGDIAYAPVRSLFSSSVGDALAERTAEDGPWGGFLIAGMITHHALKTAMSTTASGTAAWLTANLPLTLPDLFAAEIAAERVGPWGRPVLSAIAHAHGAGMPATVIRRLAAEFAAGTEPTDAEVRDALRRSRYYLRTRPDSDGTTLYRLFHQSLVDHLRTGDSLLDRLLHPLGSIVDCSRRWQLAEPYVLRHAIGHAADASRADELIEDPEFLVHADPEWLSLDHARSEVARLHAMIYRNSQDQHQEAAPQVRRHLLAVDAARFQDRELSRRFANPPWGPPLDWQPLWATGTHANPALRATMTGHAPDSSIKDVDCAIVDGRPIAVSVGGDRTIRAWDLATARQISVVTQTDIGRQSSVVCTTLHGRPVIVTTDGCGSAELWELPSLRWLRHYAVSEVQSNSRYLSGLACVEQDGRTVGVVATKSGIWTWDLDTGKPFGPAIAAAGDALSSFTGIVCTVRDGRPILVTTNYGGAIQVWDAKTGELVSTLLTSVPDPFRDPHWASAIDLAAINGHLVIVTGGRRGNVGLRDLETGEPAGGLADGHSRPIDGLRCTTFEGRVLAVTTSHGGTIRIWDLSRSAPVGGPISTESHRLTPVACTVIDGRPTIVVASGARIRLWDLAIHLSLLEAVGHSFDIRRIACLDTGSGMLAITGDYHALRAWALSTGQPVGQPVVLGNGLDDFAATILDRRPVVVTQNPDQESRLRDHLALWDLADPARRRSLSDPAWLDLHVLQERPLAVTTVDGRPLMITAKSPADAHGETLWVWDLVAARSRRIAGPRLDEGRVLSAAYVRVEDRVVVVAADDNGGVQAWDLDSLDPIGIGFNVGGAIRGFRQIVCTRLATRPVVIAQFTNKYEPKMGVWDALSGEWLATPLPALDGPAWMLACSGRVLVVGSMRYETGRPFGSVWLWDLIDECVLDEIPLPGRVRAAELLPGGRLLVGVNSDLVVLQSKENW